MIDRARVLPLVGLLALLVIGTTGCASSTPPSSSSTPPPAPSGAGSASPAAPTVTPIASHAPAETEGVGFAGVPIACYGLGQADCQRAAEEAATRLTAADPPVIYVQVGPFGCPDGQRCPTTLTARPEGDVTIEFAGAPAIGFHVKAAAGGPLEIVAQEIFGIVLEPTTTPAVLAGAQPFSLGHCGLYSGIDLGGSWWDPVGPIDADHGDSVNAAEGTIAFTDPDHATFTSKGGLTVQLQRREGDKHLPFCD
jgi:hypothetical protein